jgi:hypothetical protein
MKARDLGPYSSRKRLGNFDGRTVEGRLFTAFREELTNHCGGNPNIVQRALIERVSWVRLRLALMDEKLTTQHFTELDSRTYLSWANTLTRLLRQLDADYAAPQACAVPALGNYLSAKYTMHPVNEHQPRERVRLDD